jgi:hypothetical protein
MLEDSETGAFSFHQTIYASAGSSFLFGLTRTDPPPWTMGTLFIVEGDAEALYGACREFAEEMGTSPLGRALIERQLGSGFTAGLVPTCWVAGSRKKLCVLMSEAWR